MSALERFIERLPLPDGWSSLEEHRDQIQLGPHLLTRVGLATTGPDGTEVTGAAVSAEGDPTDRAFYELYERVAIIDTAPVACAIRDRLGEIVGTLQQGLPDPPEDDRRRPARSNGVAFHHHWEPACEAALLELCERDHVLSAWYGERGIKTVRPPGGLESIDTHRWRCGFVEPGYGTMDAFVAIVIGFPNDPSIPLARGFGAARGPSPALRKAATEAVQNLAFLWGSEVPERSPSFEPSPEFHLNYYLRSKHHKILERWMDSTHGYGRIPKIVETEVEYADISLDDAPPWGKVARALSEHAHPLIFGDPPEHVIKYLPEDRWIHPVC